jgi:hypothetical protein
MPHCRIPGFFFLLILALAAWPHSPAETQTKKDPQSKFEPRSNPGVGQAFLQQFVGDWDVVKTFHPREGEPFRSTGQCRQSMLHEGRFLQSEFVFDSKGSKSTGTGILGYDTKTELFTSIWVDSRATRMSLRQSRDKFDGKEIVMFSQSLPGDGKGPGQSRTVTRLEQQGLLIFHHQYVVGPDGKERLIMELVMTRKPTAPAKAR